MVTGVNGGDVMMMLTVVARGFGYGLGFMSSVAFVVAVFYAVLRVTHTNFLEWLADRIETI